jgi:hypothetical protein
MSKKSIVRSLCAFSFAVVGLAWAAAPVQAWDEIIIDYETHLDNPSLVQGTYTDWTDLSYPWRTSNYWPYVMNGYSRYTSSWDVNNPRHGVAVWRVQIPKTGWYSLKASYKQTENRTSEAQYYVYINATINDIKNYSATPVYHLVFDQEGTDFGQFNYAEFGEFCLKQGDVSVLVLDARETDRSSSADAAIWSYRGEVYNSKTCKDAPPPPPKPKTFSPTNYLLLREKR